MRQHIVPSGKHPGAHGTRDFLSNPMVRRQEMPAEVTDVRVCFATQITSKKVAGFLSAELTNRVFIHYWPGRVARSVVVRIARSVCIFCRSVSCLLFGF